MLETPSLSQVTLGIQLNIQRFKNQCPSSQD